MRLGIVLAGKRINFFFVLRVTVLLSMLGLAVVAYRYVDGIGAPTELIPELLRVHDEREAGEQRDLDTLVGGALETLDALELVPVERRIAAARELAEEGLARRKTWVKSGLSVAYGQVGAEMRIANHDNSDLHRAVPQLVRSVHSADEMLRLEAAYALSHVQLTPNHDEYVQTMVEALDREHSIYIKTYLARAVGDIGSRAKEAAEQMALLLVEDEPRLVTSAARAIASIGPSAYNQPLEARLVSLMAHPDAAVRDQAAEALGSIGAFSPEAQQALRTALHDDDAYVRFASALALAELGINEQPVLLALARGYELPPRTTIHVEDVARVVSIRSRAAGVFTSLGQAPDELLGTLAAVSKESGDLFAREDAVALMAGGEFSEERAQALIDLLRDRQTGVYYAVVDGLVGMGPEVVPLVTPLLDDGEPQVRELAAEVLARLDIEAASGSDANALLLRTLTTAGEWSTKARACRQLGEARAAEALAELSKYLDVSDRTLKKCALWAVLRIEPDHARAKPQHEKLIIEADELGLGVVEDLSPETLVWVPAMIEAWELADNSFSRNQVAVTMARLGHRELLDFLLARRDERVLNGPVLDVVIGRLIEDLRYYKFHQEEHLLPARRTALASLEHFGLLTTEQRHAFAGDIENVNLGDQVRAIWHEQRAARPRPPSKEDLLAKLYGDLPAPRNPDVARYAGLLLKTDKQTREGAVSGLARIGAHAVEAPDYLYRAVRDPDEPVRRRALYALYETGDRSPQAIEAYKAVLFNTDQSDALNDQAARALAEIGAPALPVLTEAGGHDAVAVRRAAAFGLLKLGADAAPARGLIERLSADSHKGVNHYARQALAALEAQP
jgi:HEAT repeat protein